MSLAGIRLVTFDATNTLLKFRRPPWTHYANVAKEYGFTGTEHDIHRSFYDNYKALWNDYPNFGRDSIGWQTWWQHVIKRTFRQNYELEPCIDKLCDHLIYDFGTSKCWKQAQSAKSLIEEIKKRNISVGVISNFDPRLDKILDEVGYDMNNFHFILTSYDARCCKPEKYIFDRALEICTYTGNPYEYKTEPQVSECLHIGDDYHNDYIAAKDAGWHSIFILNDQRLEDKAAIGEVYVSLDELKRAILYNAVNHFNRTTMPETD